jgi:hypothetical protein
MLQLLIAFIVVGALLYILNLLPIDATMKRIAWVVVIVVFAIYVIRILFGAGGIASGIF